MTKARRLGKYELECVIGLGGMAEAWKAKILGAAGFERTVVVKRILPHLAKDENFVRMFIQEAQMSALLHHPNIVQVFELGEVEGAYFMALEFVDGFDLGRVMQALFRQARAAPVPFVTGVLREVCRALAYAHDRRDPSGAPLRIVHRDVSPSNVLLGKEGAVKLLDFGVAKALGVASNRHTRTGTLTGKVSYMSPEQADGRPIDHRSDLFAVGIMLHEMLSRRRLFKAETELETLALVRGAKVDPPSLQNDVVPVALDAVCLKALARDPADRFQSAQALIVALEPFAQSWSADALGRFLADTFAGKLAHEESTESGLRSASVFGDEPSERAPTRASKRVQPRKRKIIALLGAGLLGAGLLGGGIAVGFFSREPVRPAPPIHAPMPSSPAPAPNLGTTESVEREPIAPIVAPAEATRPEMLRKPPRNRTKHRRMRGHELDFNPNSALP